MKTTILSICAAAMLMSCSPSTSNDQETAKTANASEEAVEATTQTGAIANYMTLKDALVSSDAAVANTAATELSASLTSAKMDAKMIDAANTIASSDDLKAQRVAFKTITDGMIVALKANELAEGVFVQYCPMAFDNTGANWISMSEEIRNPYYGDRMLKCGKVIEQL